MIIYLRLERAQVQREADVAQVVAHLIGSEEVTGPSPVISFSGKPPGYCFDEDSMAGVFCLMSQLLYNWFVRFVSLFFLIYSKRLDYFYKSDIIKAI